MEARRGEGKESSKSLEEEHPSSRKSKCEGPEAGLCSACWRNIREASVAVARRVSGRRYKMGGGGGPGMQGPGAAVSTASKWAKVEDGGVGPGMQGLGAAVRTV